jgi:hypothetical protein
VEVLLMNLKEIFRKFQRIFATLLALMLIDATLLMGQVTGNGVIQGTVLDPTGAMVPGATVTATNVATGVKTVRETTEAGFYVLSPLPPGEYTVTVSKTGFQTLVQEQVIVNALSVLGLNLTLKVGATTQEVTVTAAPPPLETSSGTLGITIPNDAYTSLPLAMSGGPKNPEGFIYLLPGVQNGSGFVGNINGGEAFSKEICINGLPLTTSELQGDFRNLTTATSVEVVDQFQVITNGSPAYYDGQGTENYVFKSGTNKFHGDGYWFGRNTKLDARGFFSPTVPIELQNEFGGTVGGPIKKNRVFFFGNYDGYRIRSGASPGFYSLPTAAERNGDFSALPVPIYDPATTTCTAAGICTRQQFKDNVIPPDRISAVSKYLQSFLPNPINNNLQNNFLGALTAGTDQNDFTIKVDANVTNKARLYGVTQHGRNAPVGLGPNGGPQLPLPYTSSRFGSTETWLEQMNVAYTVSPSVVNVFAFSYNRFYTPFTDPTQGGNWASKAGLKGLPPGQASDAFPPVYFNGPNSPTVWHHNTYVESFFDNTHTYTAQDNLQWIRGKHSVTVGAQFIFQQENTAQPSGGGATIGFSYSNFETAGIDPTGAIIPSTGNSYASYLLGAVDGASAVENAAGELGARYRNYAFYVQDDLKVTPRLTINLGLRWVIPKPFVEAWNRNSFLNPTQPNPAVDGYPGALQFAGYGRDSCLCRTLVQTHYKDFAPRIGFAYQINNKTVVRGSFGTFYYNAGALGGNAQSSGVSTLGFSASPSFSSPNGGITPAFNWDSGFPAYTHPPFYDPTLNTGYNTTTGPAGGGIGYGDPQLGGRAPYTQNWNLTVERELSPSTVVKASYSASNSHFLPTGIGRGIWSDQIQPQYMALGALLTQPATPANISAAQALFPGVQLPYANFQGTIGQMLRPFPQYAGVGDNFPDIGNGNYQSLQAAVQRRYSSGLQFLISYTLSKEIDDAGSNLGGFFGANGRTAYNNRLEKAVGGQDIPNQLVISYVYDLPFGNGKHMGTNNKVVSAVVSNWHLAGIQSYVRGTPQGPVLANCLVPYAGGCYADFNPNFSGPIKISGSYGSGDLLGPNPPTYLDINAFQEPASYTFGNTPRTMAYKLRNTTGLDEDFSLSRDIKLREYLTFHFAADVFNAFNRVQFSAPSTAINSAAFGQIGGQANTPRRFQVDAKLIF